MTRIQPNANGARRVTLRPIEATDTAFVLRLLGGRDTVATMLFQEFTAERAGAFVEEALASQARPEATYHRFVAVKDDPGTPVGLAALMTRPDYQDGEIWYVIDPAHRGRGFATETVLRLLEIGFGDRDLHRIWANCVPTNVASLKVLERAGFRGEGHFRESLLLHGRWEDCLHYAILRREHDQ
jgi:[ribosomal protein S5]-alanine N-acetyltransferase